MRSTPTRRKKPKQIHHYILFNKPYGVLSQFTTEAGWTSLRSYGPFPGHVYAAGRLDADSEGLLLLTDDKEVGHRLTDPAYRHPRRYLVQVEGIPDARALEHLCRGVLLHGKVTLPALVRRLEQEPGLPDRPVPIRVRKSIPVSWLEITLREGRNRQVRRMTAAVGYPTLRLVRTCIGPLQLGDLAPGARRSLTDREVRELRKDLGLPDSTTAG